MMHASAMQVTPAMYHTDGDMNACLGQGTVLLTGWMLMKNVKTFGSFALHDMIHKSSQVLFQFTVTS